MMFRITAVATFLAAISASSKISMANADTECTLCYDYSDFTFDLGPKECTEINLFRKIKAHHKQQHKETGQKCKKVGGDSSCTAKGLTRELQALTNTDTLEDARAALQALCDAELVAATETLSVGDWGSLGDIGMEDFFDGQGFLNLETGNFHQKEVSFNKKGADSFIYMGTDPRKNDHYPTTEESYQAGEAIKEFYNNEAKTSLLSSPTAAFGDENSCAQTNAAVCCWHRDRQYFDNNGNCGPKDCANQNPGDNTDLCWAEQDGEVFPYPDAGTEQDLHCHGLAWGMESDEFDLNRNAKWNNLFFVSMYDHLYTRGYAESITNDPSIAGSQAMCGCVEDMNPIARADCTEAIGRTNTTIAVSGGEGQQLLTANHVSGSFYIEFKACEGYDYVEDFGPEDYENDPNAADLEASNNDLAAFVYRLYLEGKIDEGHTEAFAETIIGYKDPTVNDGDDEREIACEAAFKERFPTEEWVEKEIAVDAEEQ